MNIIFSSNLIKINTIMYVYYTLRTFLKSNTIKKRKICPLLFVPDEEVKPFEQKEKIILIEKGHNHFEVLPEGWIQVTHNSGMHLYLHKTTRVCTLSKPYFLGPGSARVCIFRIDNR